MKRTIRFATVILFFACSMPMAFAALSTDVSIGGEYVYTTNSFADPVWSDTKAFIKQKDFGVTFGVDMFFTDTSRTGLSTSFSFRLPFSYTEQVGKGSPVAVGTAGIYTLFGSIGPIFKVALLDWLDLAVAMRIQLGALKLGDDITLGLQNEAKLTVHLVDGTFISTGLHYDLHFRKYTPNGTQPYEMPFFLMTAAPFISGGVRFGGGK